MPVSRKRSKPRTASHRPATRKRHYQHDSPTAVDLFSGFGGLTAAIRAAGFDTIMAANHNWYKTGVHEENHPYAEHWIADLVDEDSADYHDVRDLPYADMLCAGVSCTNHSIANTQRAYAEGMTLFDFHDPDFEEQVTRSERDRATANCVLHYAQRHHPKVILIECTTGLQSWGPALPGRKKVGDGSTYRWWRQQFRLLNYKSKVMYFNSMFFGVAQSRDRLFIAFWDASIPDPDLEHRPEAFCGSCDQTVEAVWSWKTGVPPSGLVQYGQQYNYTCPSCRREVVPPMTPSISALDLSNLGTRIGDRDEPLADTTMSRAERCVRRFRDFPAVMLPAGAAGGKLWQPTAATGSVIAAHRHNGDGQHLSLPMDTVTSTHEKGVVIAVNNFQGIPRGVDEPFPTQGGSETLSLVSTGVMPFRKNTLPAMSTEPVATMTAEQIPGLVVASTQLEPGSTVEAQWKAMLAELKVEDCYFRMLHKWEVGLACDFDPSFPGHEGTFKVWGSAKQQIDGYGNAVSEKVGLFIALRLKAALHGSLS